MSLWLLQHVQYCLFWGGQGGNVGSPQPDGTKLKF